MPKELYRAELVSGRVTDWSPDGKIQRYVRRWQVMKNATDDPTRMVFSRLGQIYNGKYFGSLVKQPAPYSNMYQVSATVTEDASSGGTRVWIDQVFVRSSRDSEAG
jgi:hypothetical protein